MGLAKTGKSLISARVRKSSLLKNPNIFEYTFKKTPLKSLVDIL